MRSLKPFLASDETPLAVYSANMAETAAVRRARKQAREAEAHAAHFIKARSELLGNMNHELRTPLNAIIGFAAMLQNADEYNLTDEKRKSYTDYILQSADLLLGHINTILEVAALDGGQIELHEGQFNLTDALDGAIKRAKTALDAAKITINNKTEDGLAVQAWGDEERFAQALDHIIRTGIRMSKEGSTIILRASIGPEGFPEIAVRDYGEGFSVEGVESALHAFDNAFRGLDKSFAGPGVELAIAKSFVELQGGSFAMKSRLGEGTLVRVSLASAGQTNRTDATTQKATQDCQSPVGEAETTRLAG